MLLLRTAGVLVTSLPVTLLAGLALPGPAWLGVAWLTPAAAGVALTLLLAPLFGSTVDGRDPRRLLVGRRGRRPPGCSDPVEVVEPAMQLVFAVLTLVAVAALVLRQPSFEHLGRQS